MSPHARNMLCSLPPEGEHFALGSGPSRSNLRSALLVVALLAGCASSPPSKFYTLSGPPSPAAPVAGTSLVVGPVAIPAVVDRAEIVVTVSDNEVWIDEFNRWAAPLTDNIALAAAANLAASLGNANVAVLSQAIGGGDYSIAIEVQRFESAPGAYALVDALYSVRRNADGRTASGRTTDRQVPADKTYDALAAAHSRAIARLANDIAGAVRQLSAQPLRTASSPPR